MLDFACGINGALFVPGSANNTSKYLDLVLTTQCKMSTQYSLGEVE